MALSTESISGALDNSTSIVSAFASEPLRTDLDTGEVFTEFDPTLKWQLQAVARLALGPSHRLRICCRHIRSDWNEVQVRGGEGVRPHFAGLMACGSVWCCPVCAAKIQQIRAAEVRRAIDAWPGRVLMLTLTVPHTRSDRLEDVLSRFNEAVRKMQGSRSWGRLRASYGLSGYVKGLEVTWGLANGWHPHAHVLLFLGVDVQLEPLRLALFDCWKSATARAGFGDLSPDAFNLQDGEAVKTYVTKMGSEYLWNSEHELVKSHSKRGRGGRFTPFDLLRAYLWQPDDGRMLALFAEFASAFHGRNQLTWSRGFKEQLLGTDGPTDQEIADSINELHPILAHITAEQWRFVLRGNYQGEILRIAGELGAEGLASFLAIIADTASGAQRGPPREHRDAMSVFRGLLR